MSTTMSFEHLAQAIAMWYNARGIDLQPEQVVSIHAHERLGLDFDPGATIDVKHISFDLKRITEIERCLY